MNRAAAFALLLAATATAPVAAAPMGAAEFRAIAEGWTLHFEGPDGEYYGSEEYFEGGRTVWLPQGGRCHEGLWTADSERICFFYDVGPSCWRIYADGDGAMIAESAEGENPPLRLRLIRRDRAGLICPEEPGA